MSQCVTDSFGFCTEHAAVQTARRYEFSGCGRAAWRMSRFCEDHTAVGARFDTDEVPLGLRCARRARSALHMARFIPQDRKSRTRTSNDHRHCPSQDKIRYLRVARAHPGGHTRLGPVGCRGPSFKCHEKRPCVPPRARVTRLARCLGQCGCVVLVSQPSIEGVHE